MHTAIKHNELRILGTVRESPVLQSDLPMFTSRRGSNYPTELFLQICRAADRAQSLQEVELSGYTEHCLSGTLYLSEALVSMGDL